MAQKINHLIKKIISKITDYESNLLVSGLHSMKHISIQIKLMYELEML